MTSRKTTALSALAACTLLLAATRPLAAESRPATIDVSINKPGAAIPPQFFGLMTEEINHSYDGGLFAELIQNRTFQDPPGRGAVASVAPHWSVIQNDGGTAKLSLDKENPVNPALPVSLRLDLAGAKAGIANDGYWGIPVRPDTKYTINFYAKAVGGFTGPINASIVTDDGNATVATADTSAITTGWQKYTLTFTTGHDAPTTSAAKFVLSATGNGAVEFSFISLFPPTYQDTPDGLRPDLMKLMAGLHPAFIRLPGGNYVEGSNFANRFNWKEMIGPADQRPGHMGCWSYRSSDGFGMPQYLLWCKQLGAEPVLAVFAGYTLDKKHFDAGTPEMAQYTQEALDEIEYVLGPADSEWGKRRAADGMPEPFKLRYVEIGNEDWFDRSGSYDGRFTQIAKAIRAKYPDLKLIATAPVKSFTPDLNDDHYYRTAKQMAYDSGHYDKPQPQAEAEQPAGRNRRGKGFDRTGPQTFVGEWATREGKVTATLNAALGDAAWLMGLERNADQVPIECYAPLLVNVNRGAWQWKIDLIGYDAMNSFGSASYHAQAMMAQNQGNVVLPAKLTVAQPAPTNEPAPHGAVGIGTWHTTAEYRDITVTTPDGKTVLSADLTKDIPADQLPGWTFTGDKWAVSQGALKPSAAGAETWGIAGDPTWTDYTLHLKARKTAGEEGFLILWHAADAQHYNWWNIGARNNSRAQTEATTDGNRDAFGPQPRFTVENNRWYDLRLEVTANHMKGYIDDQLVTDANIDAQPTGTPFFASAVYANDTHEAIVRVVNFSNDTMDATINLNGAGRITPTGKAIVLTGSSPGDENTLDAPDKVAPKEEPLTDAAASFHRTFPPHSFTLLRVAASVQ